MKSEIIKLLNACLRKGYIAGWEELEDDIENAIVIDCNHPDNLACILSKHLTGFFWPGENGITWTRGKNKSFSLVCQDALEEIRLARNIVCYYAVPRWTIGGNARALLAFTGLGSVLLDKCPGDEFMKNNGWHYYKTISGEYKDLYHWDMRACYGNLFKRLPSPYLTLLSSGKIVFHPLKDKEREKLDIAIDAMMQHKLMRNSFIGSIASSNGYRYQNGNIIRGGTRRSTLRASALLVVATAYELCGMAAREEGSLYSNTDCVISHRNKPPVYWEERKIPVKLEASGDSDIICSCVYKVGDHWTEFYSSYMSGDTYYERKDTPGEKIVTNWHRWIDAML